jgi:hypothetical protein
MADFPVVNTWILDIPLMLNTTDAAGNVTSAPVPATDIVTASSSSASLNAVIGPDASGNQMLSVNATVALSDSTNGGGGINVTLTDSNGDVSDVVGPFSIVGAPSVVSIANADLASAAHTRTQPVPTAPGP